LNNGPLSKLGGLVLSPLGLIQFVDLLVGIKADDRSLARLIWGVRALDERNAVHDYFMTKGLRLYFGEAYAKGVPALVEEVGTLTRQVEAEARTQRIELVSTSDREIEKALRFIEGFENRFYEKMRLEIERGNR
jgi:hypothetical protein